MLTHEPMLGLAKAAEQFLGIPVDKDAQRSDWASAELTDAQIRYAALDPIITLALYTRLMEQIEAQGTAQGFELVRATIPAIADAKARGILLDRAARVNHDSAAM